MDFATLWAKFARPNLSSPTDEMGVSESKEGLDFVIPRPPAPSLERREIPPPLPRRPPPMDESPAAFLAGGIGEFAMILAFCMKEILLPSPPECQIFPCAPEGSRPEPSVKQRGGICATNPSIFCKFRALMGLDELREGVICPELFQARREAFSRLTSLSSRIPRNGL